MLIPILSGATGACIFFALGLAFAEVINIGPAWRKFLVLTASFTVAFGSTFGSVGSGIEVFRKLYRGQAKPWDWASLIVSIVTTIVGMVMGFASLLGATEEWSRIATIYGCIVVGAFASLDTGGDMIELGGLFGSRDERYETWLEEREAWRVSTGQSVTENGQEIVTKLSQLETAISQLNHRWAWPTATSAQVNQATAHLNGDRANLTREELGVILAEHQLNLPSPSTVKRGLG
jgi:hypothetical protein